MIVKFSGWSRFDGYTTIIKKKLTDCRVQDSNRPLNFNEIVVVPFSHRNHNSNKFVTTNLEGWDDKQVVAAGVRIYAGSNFQGASSHQLEVWLSDDEIVRLMAIVSRDWPARYLIARLAKSINGAGEADSTLPERGAADDQ